MAYTLVVPWWLQHTNYIFLEMLKFSQIIFLERPNFFGEGKSKNLFKCFEIFLKFLKMESSIQLIIGCTCVEATLVLQIFIEYSKPLNFWAFMFFT
jgi:hypothetical protein